MAGVKGRSGGARRGAGRKPIDRTLALVHGNRLAVTQASLEPASVPFGPIMMPGGLSDGERAVWGELAPLALAEGTLTVSRVPAFAHFCRLVVLEKGMAAEKERCGLSAHQGMIKLVVDGYARFRLTGDGKVAVVDAKPKQLSPLEKLQAQAKQMRAK